MTDKTRDPRALAVQAFCKDAASLQQAWPLAGMQRLAAGFVAPSDGSVQCRATGSTVVAVGAEAELWLHLQADTSVPLQCQRCLATLVQPLQVDRRIRFVRNEAEAERLDEQSEDDVLSLPARLDLHELIEDELILALPLVPRHPGDCPEPLPALAAHAVGASGVLRPDGATAVVDAPPHPFAALAALKGRTGS
jgi:uncharacterized protein